MKKLAILLLLSGIVLAQPSMEKPDRNRLEMMKMWKEQQDAQMSQFQEQIMSMVKLASKGNSAGSKVEDADANVDSRGRSRSKEKTRNEDQK